MKPNTIFKGSQPPTKLSVPAVENQGSLMASFGKQFNSKLLNETSDDIQIMQKLLLLFLENQRLHENLKSLTTQKAGLRLSHLKPSGIFTGSVGDSENQLERKLKEQQEKFEQALQVAGAKYTCSLQEINREYQRKLTESQDQIRKLRFEISKLKTEQGEALNRLEECGRELERHTEMMEELKKEGRKQSTKIQEVYKEKAQLLQSLLAGTKEKEKLAEQLKVVTNKMQNKKEEMGVQRNTTKSSSDIPSMKLGQITREQIASSSREQTTRNIQQIKLETEVESLKQEIAEQYRTILMYEDKLKAYEARINSLQTSNQISGPARNPVPDYSGNYGFKEMRRQTRKPRLLTEPIYEASSVEPAEKKFMRRPDSGYQLRTISYDTTENSQDKSTKQRSQSLKYKYDVDRYYLVDAYDLSLDKTITVKQPLGVADETKKRPRVNISNKSTIQAVRTRDSDSVASRGKENRLAFQNDTVGARPIKFQSKYNYRF